MFCMRIDRAYLNKFPAFYAQYENQDQELIVLLDHAIQHNTGKGFWINSVALLGVKDCATGTVHACRGVLQWPASKRSKSIGQMGLHKFRPGQICRVKARKKLARYTTEKDLAEGFQTWSLIEILVPRAFCPPLQNIWAEYQKTVRIEDEQLGTLELDKKAEVLEGEFLWNGTPVFLLLYVSAQDRSTWQDAIATAKTIITELPARDIAMREFAAQELTVLANDWQEEGAERPPITEKTFAKAIELSGLVVHSSGRFTVCYSDGNFFAEHTIQVTGSLADGLETADITG